MEFSTLSNIAFLLLAMFATFQVVFKRDLLSPGSVYITVQLATLGVAFLALQPAMVPFKITTWLILGISAFAFLGGTAMVKAYFLKHALNPIPIADRQLKIQALFQQVAWTRVIALALVLTIPVLISWMVLYNKLGSITVMRHDILKLMGVGGLDIGIIGFPLPMYTMVPMVLYPAMHQKLNSGKSRWVARLFFVLVIIGGFAMYPARNPLMILFVYMVAFRNYAISQFRLRSLLIAMSVVLVIFIGGMLAKKQVEDLHGNMDAVWKYPYMYIANNYWNLDYASNPPTDREIHPQTWGYSLAGGVLLLNLWPDWIGFGKAYHWDNQFNKRAMKVHGLNTHGYWWNLYKDFGMVGITVFPLLAGIWLGWLYNRIRTTPTVVSLVALSYAIHFVVFIFFVDFWGIVITPLMFAAILLVYFVSAPKGLIEER